MGVHQIISAHKGSIAASSEVGVGTEFRFCLPRAPGTAEPVDLPSEDHDVSGDECVLFIEDEADTARIISDILRMQGYTVHAFASPIEALERFKEEPQLYDLVIADFTMPGMKGTLLSSALQDIRPDLPAVMISGVADVLSKEDLQAARISKRFGKPLTGMDYAAAIRQVLDGRKV